MASSTQNRYTVAIFVWSLLCLVPRSSAQNPSTSSRDVMVVPDIMVQTGDYAELARDSIRNSCNKAPPRIKRIARIPNPLSVLPKRTSPPADYASGLG